MDKKNVITTIEEKSKQFREDFRYIMKMWQIGGVAKKEDLTLTKPAS